MIIVCPSCQARYKFDESKLGQRAKAKTKCAKCGSAIEIENPLFGAMTLPPSPEPPAAPPEAPAPAPAAEPPEESTRKTRTLDPTLRGNVGGRVAASTSQDIMDSRHLELAAGKRYSLAVLQGAATGQIFTISKPRIILGRAGADINLDDAEASRQHAAVEILGDHAIVRDLGSTNGTFVDAQRIEQQVITNQGEFRIGSHVLMLIVTDLE